MESTRYRDRERESQDGWGGGGESVGRWSLPYGEPDEANFSEAVEIFDVSGVLLFSSRGCLGSFGWVGLGLGRHLAAEDLALEHLVRAAALVTKDGCPHELLRSFEKTGAGRVRQSLVRKKQKTALRFGVLTSRAPEYVTLWTAGFWSVS